MKLLVSVYVGHSLVHVVETQINVPEVYVNVVTWISALEYQIRVM